MFKKKKTFSLWNHKGTCIIDLSGKAIIDVDVFVDNIRVWHHGI
jgi:hypothetical protein